MQNEVRVMITLEDCIAFCGLTEDEVLAQVAAHDEYREYAGEDPCQ